MTEIKFTLRNEKGLHCRFCKVTRFNIVNLFETSPIKGIVCEDCKRHLESYVKTEE
jgi:hypothetical protein